MRIAGLVGMIVCFSTAGCANTVENAKVSSQGASASGVGGAGGSSASVSTSGSTGTGGADLGPTVYLGSNVVRSPSGAPLEGVALCVLDRPEFPCVTSEAEGAFTLQVPANAEIGITLEKTGSGSIVVPITTDSGDQLGWIIGVPTVSALGSYYQAAGVTYPDAASGFLSVFVNDGTMGGESGLEGVSVAIKPSSGVGPLYSSPNGTADLSLQATSTQGAARFGEIAAGVVEVSLAPSTLACDPWFGGWLSPNPNTVRVPIAAGFQTNVGLGCY